MTLLGNIPFFEDFSTTSRGLEMQTKGTVGLVVGVLRERPDIENVTLASKILQEAMHDHDSGFLFLDGSLKDSEGFHDPITNTQLRDLKLAEMRITAKYVSDDQLTLEQKADQLIENFKTNRDKSLKQKSEYRHFSP